MASPFANFANATTAEGRKLWELATKPLKSLFDGTKSGYPLFKSQLRNRIRECHWGDIVNFTINGNLELSGQCRSHPHGKCYPSEES